MVRKSRQASLDVSNACRTEGGFPTGPASSLLDSVWGMVDHETEGRFLTGLAENHSCAVIFVFLTWVRVLVCSIPMFLSSCMSFICLSRREVREVIARDSKGH